MDNEYCIRDCDIKREPEEFESISCQHTTEVNNSEFVQTKCENVEETVDQDDCIYSKSKMINTHVEIKQENVLSDTDNNSLSGNQSLTVEESGLSNIEFVSVKVELTDCDTESSSSCGPAQPIVKSSADKLKDAEERALRRRRLANERQKRWRAKQTQESLAKIRALDAASHRERLKQMTAEQLVAYHTAHSNSQQRYVEKLSEEQLADLHVRNAASQQRRIKRMTPEQLTAHRIARAQTQQRYVERMTARQSADYLASHKESQQRYVDRLSPQKLDLLHMKNALCQRERIKRMTPEQLAAHRVARAAAQQRYMQRRKATSFHISNIESQQQLTDDKEKPNIS